jgi:beta-lactam-binding protein with PASTA domain
MPNLTGKPVAEATAVVQKAGFKVGKIQPVTDDSSGNAAGVVVRQYPQAGQRVPEGSTISFDMKK